MAGTPRITVGGVLIQNHKILLGKRRPDRLYPDIWDIFGGHVEPYETFEEALIRELEEELGVMVAGTKFIASYQDRDPTFGYDYLHHIYLIISWKGEPYNKNPMEHEDIGWFSRAECAHLKMHGAVQNIVMEKVDF
ncbi:MAG: NUDIX hydrolase [Thermoplasmata archaeon]|nr:MAG: NUDIX hydrolase [Thermoplasmata archaeon]